MSGHFQPLQKRYDSSILGYDYPDAIADSIQPGIKRYMKLLLTLIGLVFVLEGLPYLAFPEAMQRWLRQLLEMPPGQLRFMGLLSMAFGFFLCFLTQKSGLFP